MFAIFKSVKLNRLMYTWKIKFYVKQTSSYWKFGYLPHNYQLIMSIIFTGFVSKTSFTLQISSELFH